MKDEEDYLNTGEHIDGEDLRHVIKRVGETDNTRRPWWTPPPRSSSICTPRRSDNGDGEPRTKRLVVIELAKPRVEHSVYYIEVFRSSGKNADWEATRLMAGMRETEKTLTFDEMEVIHGINPRLLAPIRSPLEIGSLEVVCGSNCGIDIFLACGKIKRLFGIPYSARTSSCNERRRGQKS